MALRLVLHLSSSCVSSASFSGGRQISCFTESRVRPRNDKAMRGPLAFSMATACLASMLPGQMCQGHTGSTRIAEE